MLGRGGWRPQAAETGMSALGLSALTLGGAVVNVASVLEGVGTAGCLGSFAGSALSLSLSTLVATSLSGHGISLRIATSYTAVHYAYILQRINLDVNNE